MEPTTRWVNPYYQTNDLPHRRMPRHAAMRSRRKSGKGGIPESRGVKASGSQSNPTLDGNLSFIKTLTSIIQNVDLERVRTQITELNHIVQQVNGVIQQINQWKTPPYYTPPPSHPYYHRQPYYNSRPHSPPKKG